MKFYLWLHLNNINVSISQIKRGGKNGGFTTDLNMPLIAKERVQNATEICVQLVQRITTPILECYQ